MFGLEKYWVVTSPCRGDIWKKGPSKVATSSVPGGTYAARKKGDSIRAFTSAGYREIVRKALIQRLASKGKIENKRGHSYKDIGFVVIVHAHLGQLPAEIFDSPDQGFFRSVIRTEPRYCFGEEIVAKASIIFLLHQ